jgi:trehalose synthase
VFQVQVRLLDISRLTRYIGAQRQAALMARAAQEREVMAGRVLWNVNSTATGGGVAEMLAQLVAYASSAGVDTRWLVAEGTPDFFAITKRIHNWLHGSPGDGGELGRAEQRVYQEVTDTNLEELRQRVRPGDIVILHDPQTAGLSRIREELGVPVLWRCHVGKNESDTWTERAWDFLRPHLEPADVHVFSRESYAPKWIDRDRLMVIPPSIDPFSAKNQPMDEDTMLAILVQTGLLAGRPAAGAPTFRREDGAIGVVERQATVIREGSPPPLGTRLVVQVSRWDRLKDMQGVLEGFAAGVTLHGGYDDTHLYLVGPSVERVADDPEGQQVLAECAAAWGRLPEQARRQCSLVSLPMQDIEENAAIVNAIQRFAAIVVQKSVMEGFGLTVSEAMWKARPVVATAVGGIRDQIVDEEHGLLPEDPTDLDAFAAAVRRLLDDPGLAARLGAAAQQRVTDRFLPDRHLLQWTDVLFRLGLTRSR